MFKSLQTISNGIRQKSTNGIYKYYLPFFPTPTYKFDLKEYENEVLQDIADAEKSGVPIDEARKRSIANCLTRIEERGDKKLTLYNGWSVKRNDNEFDQEKHMTLGTLSRFIIASGILIAGCHPYPLDAMEIAIIGMYGFVYVFGKTCALAFVTEKNQETKHEISVISAALNKNVYHENKSSREKRFGLKE